MLFAVIAANVLVVLCGQQQHSRFVVYSLCVCVCVCAFSLSNGRLVFSFFWQPYPSAAGSSQPASQFHCLSPSQLSPLRRAVSSSSPFFGNCVCAAAAAVALCALN